LKLVYTHENRMIVSNAKNLLEAAGFDVLLKNEFAGGGLGELPVFDTWMELWVSEDTDYARACELLETALSDTRASAWLCPQCGEQNDASFELCWQCGADNTQTA
jgi:predicted RNA-binding Zn-ribbon protein involved in translation (DUF1610 family)